MSDIEALFDEYFEDEMPTIERDVEEWVVLGQDMEDDDDEETTLVIEALNTAAPTPWYERLSNELEG